MQDYECWTNFNICSMLKRRQEFIIWRQTQKKICDHGLNVFVKYVDFRRQHESEHHLMFNVSKTSFWYNVFGALTDVQTYFVQTTLSPKSTRRLAEESSGTLGSLKEISDMSLMGRWALYDWFTGSRERGGRGQFGGLRVIFLGYPLNLQGSPRVSGETPDKFL